MLALVGAVVGFVVATALVAVLGSYLGLYSYLAVLFAGIAAGLLMRMLASGSGSPYAKGALAALVTGVAAVSGQLALANWHQAQGAAIPKPSAKVMAESPNGDQATDAAGDGLDETAVEVAALPDNVGTPSAYSMPATGQGPDTENIVCMVLGCLLAYQLGKGTPAAAASEEADLGSESEAPAEGPADEANGDA